MPKENKTLPNLSKFRARATFISMEYPLHLLSPIRRESSNEKDSELPLKELGGALGMNIKNETVASSFARGQRRFDLYKRLYLSFSVIGYLLIGVPMFIFLAAVFALSGINYNNWALIPILMLFYMCYKLSNRIVSVLLDRYYADTLSFVTCLYLLANVAKQDALAQPQDRKQLLARIRGLRKYLILLPHQFATSSLPQTSLAPTQFRSMAEFTEEKENEIIAPCASTQLELFAELQAFSDVLLTANYGEFKYKSSALAETPTSSDSSTGALTGILKLIGTVLPLALLLFMYFFPAQFSFLGIENKVVALVSLAWLLLAIDANLKLGIVDRVSSLAKAFRDLA